jgi:uncharacterized repeat protein (TIGR03803 family)
MNSKFTKQLILLALNAVFVIAAADCARAQTFTTLHSFNGSDGDSPYGDLVLSSNKLFGTTAYGGGSGNGNVFSIGLSGTGFTVLHDFTGSDGSSPAASLIVSGNTLFGTTQYGGSNGKGTVFRINTDGTGFTNLFSFTAATDGANPAARLLLSGNTLFGTATFGGSSGKGTLFCINTDGTGFTNLHTFSSSDGNYPSAGLIFYSNTLYGTVSSGGSFNRGAVFSMNADGTGFTNLYNFSQDTFTITYNYYAYTNSDGAYPQCVLALSGNTLYGTTPQSGLADRGAVFAVNIDGTGFTNLHNFSPTVSNTNSDGRRPDAGVILLGNTLYGTTEYGGGAGYGVVFAVNADGSGFQTLHTFSNTSATSPHTNYDGGSAYAGLVASGNTLYGATIYGGSSGKGTLFRIDLAAASVPQLAISRSDANVILTWTTNVAGFALQCATNLIPPVIWNTNNLPSPVIVNGLNTVTNAISDGQMYYRLVQ